ncbi:unnamed protein product [Prunus brigantina]
MAVPKMIKWSDITLPEKWILDEVAPKKPLENQEPTRISQFADGEVEIQFSSARRTRIDLAPSRSNLEPHRSSTSSDRAYDLEHERMVLAGLRRTQEQIQRPAYRNNIEMIGSPFSTYTSKDGKSVKAIHLPEMVIKQKDVIATPYKETTFLEDNANNFRTTSKEDVGAVIQQNNYTNMFLQYLGKQVTRIETSVSMKEQKSEPGPS